MVSCLLKPPLTILHGAFPWRAQAAQAVEPSQPANPPPPHLLTSAEKKEEEEEPWPDWPDAEEPSWDELDDDQKAVVEAFKVPRV